MGWPQQITFDLGGLLAGILGFVAAIGAVLITLCTERRRAKRELKVCSEPWASRLG